jgi:hypothetical protein
MSYKNITVKAKEAKSTTLTVVKNIIEFIQASSLVIVAAYAGYAVKTGMVKGFVAYAIAVAASIIAVRGCYELLKSFNKQ